MIRRTIISLVSALPVTAGAFGMIEENNQTRLGPGGNYGVYQRVHYSSTLPGPAVHSYVCFGASAVFVASIDYRIDDPKSTGLRELWALPNYRTNSLPPVWRPEQPPPRPMELSAFLGFTPETHDFSISGFIGRHGLPSRYLTAHWNVGQVFAITQGIPVADETHSPQGPDFLIYDLPSGHSVVLYVSQPDADDFTTAVIIDPKGNLLVPNMVELLLPRPREQLISSRRITAEIGGKVKALDENGQQEVIGTWRIGNGQLVITTTKKSSDEFAHDKSVWFEDVEYATCIYVNYHEVICSPIVSR
jgi:hypothetical protein